MDYASLTQEVSEWNNVSKWPKIYSCDILPNNVAAFSLCPKILLEVKLKSGRLMVLAGKISRQPVMGCIMWLLLATIMQIYNEAGQRNTKYTVWGEKQHP